MKALLTTCIVFSLQQLFAQADMDTSKIVMARIGWKIENNLKDSCLYDKLYKYSSGLFREELQLCSESSTITISKREIERPFYGQDFIPVFTKYLTNGSVDTKRYYYDDAGYLDSIVLNAESGKRAVVSRSAKRFDSKDRLETIKNHEGTLQYEYDTEGKLKQTVLTRSNGSRKADTYEKGKLTNESWFDTGNTKYVEQKYKYDRAGNLIQADLNEYEHWSYEYNKYGLAKEEKWGGADTKKLIEQVIYTYDRDGKLTAEEWFEQGESRKLIKYYYE